MNNESFIWSFFALHWAFQISPNVEKPPSLTSEDSFTSAGLHFKQPPIPCTLKSHQSVENYADEDVRRRDDEQEEEINRRAIGLSR